MKLADLPDPTVVLNGLALVIVAGLGGALIFHEVPDSNAQIVGVVVGGILTFLTGGANRNKPPPQPPQP